ncbi:flagellar hook-length control FliK family protein [Clostridium argentinense CDC 2741]|uniref:Flagellar hook-length control FliK family protein n=1 Tax=Clostridium argentinense CDC 2741 TaxID=1418104 RepID=A0A0C1U1P2_9CLOT|nr:flagellar hook-length control protein FliK [Clostridium argentinense]ARC85301.1 flagellar hook-length control protein FliK [Clostridium argentinense]KIE46849.1 flagellar hook-length control FliK family protein [Clostridium argentinense CDC 2741]NFF40923.1 flagellar hook-length control protein FliK [Clostridium argentinense]NFP51366.1 flagellar hook-length control protein FliK [Clostridium argentinense]NFP73404.1 flagellar hook-length control protein FliK [Clostridium argentinense]
MNNINTNILEVLQNQSKPSSNNNTIKAKESKVSDFEKVLKKVSEPSKNKTNSLEDKGFVKEEILEDIEEGKDNGRKDIIALLLNMFSAMENDKNININVEGLIENIEGIDNSTLDLVKTLLKNVEDLTELLDNKALIKDNNPLKDMLLKLMSVEGEDKDFNLEVNKLIKKLTEALPKLEDISKAGIASDNSKVETFKDLNSTLIAAREAKDDTGKDKVSVEIKPEDKIVAKEDKIAIENKNSKNTSNGDLKKSLSSEEKLLEKLIGEKEDGKLTKVNQFMNAFNNSKISLEEVKNVDKLLINKVTFSEDIVKSIRFMELNNIKDLTVKINPKHLGEVIISLTMEQEAMRAQLKASNKDTVALLNANLRDITEKLNENIKIQQVEVAIYNDDTTYFSGNERENRQGFNGEQSKNKVSAITEEIELETEASIIDDSSLNLLI